MKKINQFFVVISLAALFASFTTALSDGNWYICSGCCKTKMASQAPWESGCKASGSTHNYSFAGKAGDYNYSCRNCGAEVYLTSSQSPNGSKCCATGGTHNWSHR